MLWLNKRKHTFWWIQVEKSVGQSIGFSGYKRLIVVEFYSGSNVNDIGFSATVYVMDIYNKSIHARVLLNTAIDYLWFLFCFIRRFKWSIPFLFYYRLKHKHWIIKRIERSIISYSPISFIFGLTIFTFKCSRIDLYLESLTI